MASTFESAELVGRRSSAGFTNLRNGTLVVNNFKIGPGFRKRSKRIRFDSERTQAGDKFHAGGTSAKADPMRNVAKPVKHHGDVRCFSARETLHGARAMNLSTDKRRQRETLVYRGIGADAEKHKRGELAFSPRDRGKSFLPGVGGR